MFGCAARSAPPPAPPAPSTIACTAVAAHVAALFGAGTDHAYRVHEVVLARCVQDGWPEPARRCFLDEADLHGGRRCQDRLAAAPRVALVHGLDVARWPSIDPTRDPCELLHDLATRIDSCTAVDLATRSTIRERTDRVAAEPAVPGPAESAVSNRRIVGLVRRPAPRRVILGALLEPDESPVTAECRGDVDALVKLGAERCGW